MKNLKLFLSVVLLLFISCSDDDSIIAGIEENKEATIVFGRYSNHCFGGETCVEIFKLSNGVLLEDVVDELPSSKSFYQGVFSKKVNTSRTDADMLIRRFPQELFKEINGQIGSSTNRDKSGIYIEYKDANTHSFWLIDVTSNNFPKYLHSFVADINIVIDDVVEVSGPQIELLPIDR